MKGTKCGLTEKCTANLQCKMRLNVHKRKLKKAVMKMKRKETLTRDRQLTIKNTKIQTKKLSIRKK